jgi:hypothetical protein
LIPKQRIRREKAPRNPTPAERGALYAVIWDPRCWVPMCGGAMGNAGHHGKFDAGGVGKLVIPRDRLPAAVEEFAEEHGLGWSLEADYGQKEVTG